MKNQNVPPVDLRPSLILISWFEKNETVLFRPCVRWYWLPDGWIELSQAELFLKCVCECVCVCVFSFIRCVLIRKKKTLKTAQRIIYLFKTCAFQTDTENTQGQVPKKSNCHMLNRSFISAQKTELLFLLKTHVVICVFFSEKNKRWGFRPYLVFKWFLLVTLDYYQRKDFFPLEIIQRFEETKTLTLVLDCWCSN